MLLSRESVRSFGGLLSTFVALLSVIASAHAGSIASPELPTPLRSADLQKWKSELKPSDAQRAAMEQAFDDCIDAWQRLRDGTVRPAEAKFDATTADEKAAAAWRATIGRATDSMAASERAMFDAMRAACADDAQRAQLDRLAAARARRRASAAVRTMGVNLPRVPDFAELADEVRAKVDRRQAEWELSATPLVERLASATIDGADDRERDLARRVLLSQRAAARDVAALLPADVAARYLRDFRRRALPKGSSWSGYEPHTPESLRKQLDPATQADAIAKLDVWQKRRDELQEQALDALVAAGAPGEMLAALSDDLRKLNAESLRGISESAGMPELVQESEGIVLTMGDDGEGDASGAGFEVIGDASGPGGVAVMRSMTVGDVPGAEGTAVMSSVVVVRVGDGSGAMPDLSNAEIRVQGDITDMQNLPPDLPVQDEGSLPPEAAARLGEAVANAITDGGDAAMLGEPGAMSSMSMGRTRPLSRQDVEAIRVRLAVPDTQRAVWDALAGDLLQAQGDLMKRDDSSPLADMMPAQGQSVDAFLQARAARRAELARVEMQWFDGVKAGVQGVPPEAIETERARRALQRAVTGAQGGSMFVPSMAISRSMRIDLDAAADTLSAEGRVKAAAALATWRADLTAALDAMAPLVDDAAKAQFGLMQATTQEDESGDTRASMSLSIDEKQLEQLEKARKPVQDGWKRIEALQQAAVQAVTATLGEGDARALRRAVLKQTHPEAFRSQERVDAALNRALSLQGLSAEQLQAISALGDQYRAQSETLVERSIERTDRADAALNGLFGQDGATGDPMDGFRAMKGSERNRGDATYDREELNARALRRLRAALTPEQAAAAKLN